MIRSRIKLSASLTLIFSGVSVLSAWLNFGSFPSGGGLRVSSRNDQGFGACCFRLKWGSSRHRMGDADDDDDADDGMAGARAERPSAELASTMAGLRCGSDVPGVSTRISYTLDQAVPYPSQWSAPLAGP